MMLYSHHENNLKIKPVTFTFLRIFQHDGLKFDKDLIFDLRRHYKSASLAVVATAQYRSKFRISFGLQSSRQSALTETSFARFITVLLPLITSITCRRARWLGPQDFVIENNEPMETGSLAFPNGYRRAVIPCARWTTAVSWLPRDRQQCIAAVWVVLPTSLRRSSSRCWI